MISYDSYRESLSSERKQALDRLRELVLSKGSSLTESMQYRMPTYSEHGEVLFAFASQKHHLAFYVCHYDVLRKFKKELEIYDCGKSCIRFKKVDEDLLVLLGAIIDHTLENRKKSEFYGKYAAK